MVVAVKRSLLKAGVAITVASTYFHEDAFAFAVSLEFKLAKLKKNVD